MEEIAPLDAYLSGPGILRAAVTGLSREQMISRPITGRWSLGSLPTRGDPVLSAERLDTNSLRCAGRVPDRSAQGNFLTWTGKTC